MASSEAYAVHGMMFLAHGTIWVAKEIMRRQGQKSDEYSYNNILRYDLDTDGITKLFGTVFCAAVVYCADEADGLVYHVTKLECILMYILVGISGIMDIMVAKFRRLPLWTRNAAFTSALLGESFVFVLNFKTFSDVDVHLHCALVLIISFAIIFELVECMFSQNTTTALTRGFLAIIHGSCLIGIAIMKNKQQYVITG